MNHEPVTISTFADLIAKGYRLTFHCNSCLRNEPVDLTVMPQTAQYWGRTWQGTKYRDLPAKAQS
jgi:hypothetical protein